jgi:antitoxin (DNA-binding transcriptional repressor) of toxin-antitoxin stability system
MKLVGIRQAREKVSEILGDAQKQRVILTRHGKPTALVIGLEGEDLEEVQLRSDAAFWREIAERRKANQTISSKALRARLGMPTSRARRLSAK